MPQSPDVLGKRLVPDARSVRVTTFFQAKTTNPQTVGDYVGAFGDYLGPSLSLLLGDKAGGLAGLLTESAYRMSFWPSRPFTLHVKDWMPCGDGGWTGTIAVNRSFSTEDKARSNWGDGSLVTQKHATLSLAVKLVPGKDGAIDAAGVLADLESGKSRDAGTKMCPREEGNAPTPFDYTKTTTGQARGAVPANVNIQVRGTQASFTLNAGPIDKAFIITDVGSDACDRKNNYSRSTNSAITKRYAFSFDGTADPKTPNDLVGSTTISNGPEQTTYKWDLHQCTQR